MFIPLDKKKEKIFIDIDNDNFKLKPRNKCSGGISHFFILPDGSFDRCAAQFYYGNKKILGNLTHLDIRNKIINKKLLERNNCTDGLCIRDCDGMYTEQEFSFFPKKHLGLQIKNKKMNQRNFAILQTHLTSLCNYSCDYCCAQYWMKKLKNKDLNTEKWLEIFDFFINSYDIGYCVLMGGEPLISKSFLPVCKKILDNNWNLDVLTNFSKPEVIFQLLDSVNINNINNNFLLFISLHPVINKFDFENIKNNIFSLKEKYNKIKISISMVNHETNKEWWEENDIFEEINKMGIEWCSIYPVGIIPDNHCKYKYE